MKECPKNMQGNGTGRGINRLPVVASHQEKDNSSNVVTHMIKVFTADVYTLLDRGASVCYVTPYGYINFVILSEQIFETFNVSTHGCASILADIVYLDCTNSIIHKNTMGGLAELDMVRTGFMTFMTQLIVELKLLSSSFIMRQLLSGIVVQ